MIRKCIHLKRLLCVGGIVVFSLMVTALHAQTVHGEWLFHRSNKIRQLRGTLVDINYKYKNITIEDEFTKLSRRFYVPFKPIDHLKLGDEVRVYYYPGSNDAISVKKMTPVEYIKEEQNKGYLLKSKEDEGAGSENQQYRK